MVSLYAVQWSSISLSPSVNLDRSFKLSQQRFAVRLEGKSRILVCLGLGRAAAGSAGISEKSGLGATSKEVIELERKVVVQTYARAPLVLVRGKGCKVYDAEGQEYLDMGAGIAVNSMGHGDPDLLKAIGEATELIHVSNVYYTIPQVELGKCLVECSFADRVFFSNSGTEANEAAIKFSRKFQRFYWPDVKLPAMEFIAFTNSFHGRTMGSLALTSKKNYRSPFEPVMPGVTFIEYGNIEMARNAIQPGKTAAVFVEPVQGEGGIYCAGKEFLQALRIACDDAGALLIFDELRKIERSLQGVFTNQSISPLPVHIGVEEDKVGARVFLSWELTYRDRTGSLSNPDGKQKPRAVLLQILICFKKGLGSVEICTDQRDQLIKVGHYGEHQGAIAAIRSCRTTIIRGGQRSLD